MTNLSEVKYSQPKNVEGQFNKRKLEDEARHPLKKSKETVYENEESSNGVKVPSEKVRNLKVEPVDTINCPFIDCPEKEETLKLKIENMKIRDLVENSIDMKSDDLIRKLKNILIGEYFEEDYDAIKKEPVPIKVEPYVSIKTEVIEDNEIPETNTNISTLNKLTTYPQPLTKVKTVKTAVLSCDHCVYRSIDEDRLKAHINLKHQKRDEKCEIPSRIPQGHKMSSVVGLV